MLTPRVVFAKIKIIYELFIPIQPNTGRHRVTQFNKAAHQRQNSKREKRDEPEALCLGLIFNSSFIFTLLMWTLCEILF